MSVSTGRSPIIQVQKINKVPAPILSPTWPSTSPSLSRVIPRTKWTSTSPSWSMKMASLEAINSSRTTICTKWLRRCYQKPWLDMINWIWGSSKCKLSLIFEKPLFIYFSAPFSFYLIFIAGHKITPQEKDGLRSFRSETDMLIGISMVFIIIN